MNNLESLSLCYREGQVLVLDQTLLPHQENWIVAESPTHMANIILRLQIRGAPAIGVSAAVSLADYALKGATEEEIKSGEQILRVSRPTAVNLMICLDRMLKALETSKEAMIEEAEKIFIEDVELCEKMGLLGAKEIQEGEGILTHCNTGGLATVGIGTALGVIRKAHEQEKKIHVYIDETRPLLQGGRLTAWECQKLGIPCTLITDNMAAMVMSQGKVQRVLVGSDRIAMNGDFANKIGTYNLGVLCQYHKIPFHGVAPYTTIDPKCPEGKDIPIEERKDFEVKGVRGSFGEVQWAPDVPVFNPAFDVTPHKLLTSFIFDHGVFTPDLLSEGLHLKRN